MSGGERGQQFGVRFGSYLPADADATPAPTGTLKHLKPSPSLPRDGWAGREYGFALTQPQSRPQRALECCANMRTARKAKRSARCARKPGELLVLAAKVRGQTRDRDP